MEEFWLLVCTPSSGVIKDPQWIFKWASSVDIPAKIPKMFWNNLKIAKIMTKSLFITAAFDINLKDLNNLQ